MSRYFYKEFKKYFDIAKREIPYRYKINGLVKRHIMGQHLNVDFKIRLPHELKDKIRQSAELHNRTMTADIVARLEESFDNKKLSDDELSEKLTQILTEIQSLKEKTT